MSESFILTRTPATVGEANYFKQKTNPGSAMRDCRRLVGSVHACTITIVRRQRAELLTLGKAWRVVVDVGELDGDSGGPRQAAKVSPHVFGLKQHQILVLGLPVHVGDSCAQDT